MDIIIQQFLRCTPIKYIDLNILNNLSWEDQLKLCQNTIKNDIVQKFPIAYTYQITFLKHIIDYFENKKTEIHDEIYELYCFLMQNSQKYEKYFYKHYKIKSDIISLKESSSIIINGTTGLCTWEAAIVLAEWCLQNLNELENKTIVELGSGIGFTGIIISKFCNPKFILLTDHHSDVIKVLNDNIRHNCELNKKNISNINKQGNISINIDVMKLPWEMITENIDKTIVADVLIGADIVFDPSTFDALLNAFNCFLKINKKCEIILACTIRNEETLNIFFSLSKKYDLSFVKLLQPTSQYIFLHGSNKVNIYRFKRNKYN